MARQAASFRHPYSDITPDRRRVLTARLLRHAGEEKGEARDRLIDEVVLVNISVAHSIAARYRGRGIPTEDLEQVACAALVRAARQYDGGHERDFLAYAVPSIRGEVRRHFRDQGWTVRPPRRLQELRLRVLDERDRQRGEGVAKPTDATVAAALGVPEDDVRESLATDGCFSPTSLDQRVGEDAGLTIGDLIADPADGHDYAAVEARVVLQPVMRRLKPRDRRLLRMRFEEELTQREIAETFGVTQTQVSRLLQRVLRDLRSALDQSLTEIAAADAAEWGSVTR